MNLSKASGTSFRRSQYAGKVLPMYPDYCVTYVPGPYPTAAKQSLAVDGAIACLLLNSTRMVSQVCNYGLTVSRFQYLYRAKAAVLMNVIGTQTDKFVLQRR
jgi:hypothetical protein